MKMDISTLWIVLGILLVIGEMISSGFFLLFIALGCFAAALMASIGLGYTPQGMTFAVVSVLGILTLRKPIQKRLLSQVSIKADIGKEINVDQAILPHQQTRIMYQGTTWQATNLDSEVLNQGDRVVIVGIDRNTLLLRKVN